MQNFALSLQKCRIYLSAYCAAQLLDGLCGPLCAREVRWLGLSFLQAEACVEQIVHVLSQALLNALKALRLASWSRAHNSVLGGSLA